MKNSLFFSLASTAIRVYGAYAETSSHRFIVKGTKPGKNAAGYWLDNCYKAGSPGVVDRISRKPEPGREQLSGNFKTFGKGIYAYEVPISSPAEQFNFIADALEFSEPLVTKLFSRLHKKNEVYTEAQYDPDSVSFQTAYKNLHYTQTNNDTVKALPPPKNNASENFRKAANSPFFANNDLLEKLDTHLQNRNNS